MSKVSLKNVLLSFPHLFSKQQRIKTMTFVSSKASDRGILLPFQPELHHTSKNNLFKGNWDCWYFMWFQMLKIFFHGWDRMEKLWMRWRVEGELWELFYSVPGILSLQAACQMCSRYRHSLHSSLFSGLCAHGVTCHIFRKITARSFFFFPGAIQALPRGLGIGRKGPKWGKAVEAVALAVWAAVRAR